MRRRAYVLVVWVFESGLFESFDDQWIGTITLSGLEIEVNGHLSLSW